MLEAVQGKSRSVWVRCAWLISIVSVALFSVSSAQAQCTRGSCENTPYGTNTLVNITSGGDNSAFGAEAAVGDSSGVWNSAFGAFALNQNSTGSGNTAVGGGALHYANSDNNTAVGTASLDSDTSGMDNVATGAFALQANQLGSGNTAIGYEALQYDETGNNTAVGNVALAADNSGTQNAALGGYALNKLYDGSYNTATGFGALKYDVHGSNSTADGINALLVSTASNNTGIGANALINTTGGTGNIALGYNAGKNVTTGSNNIDIGNVGAAEGQTIRIGTQGTQNRAFVAGITAVTFTGPDVMVNTTTGQLGYASSSARFKRDIRDMGEASSPLMKLRPVTFIYKEDPSNTRQYGLVAEEVRTIYPDLVTYDSNGRIETVRYSALTTMLLNELQKQERNNQRQTALIAKLSSQVAELKAVDTREIAQMHGQITALEQAVMASQKIALAAGK